MLGNSSILYLLLCWKTSISDLHFLSPVVVQLFKVSFLIMFQWHFLLINGSSPSIFFCFVLFLLLFFCLFVCFLIFTILEKNKQTNIFWCGFKSASKILFCSKGSSMFHKFMFAYVPHTFAPLQSILCCVNTNTGAWKDECPKIWSLQHSLEGGG